MGLWLLASALVWLGALGSALPLYGRCCIFARYITNMAISGMVIRESTVVRKVPLVMVFKSPP